MMRVAFLYVLLPIVIWVVGLRLIKAALRKTSLHFQIDLKSPGERRLTLWTGIVLGLHHLLLALCFYRAFFPQPPDDDFGYSTLVFFVALGYTILQGILLWVLQQAGREHRIFSGIFRAGLMALVLALILTAGLNWSLFQSYASGKLTGVVFYTQLYLTALIWTASLLTALGLLLTAKLFDSKQATTPPRSSGWIRSLIAGGGALAVLTALLYAHTGFHVQPAPYSRPLVSRQLGTMSLGLPLDWETSTWMTRMQWPGVEYFEFSETLFTNRANADQEIKVALRDQTRQMPRPERDQEAPGDWVDVSHLFQRPARILTLTDLGHHGDKHYLSFVLVVTFAEGWLTILPKVTEPTDLSRFQPVPYAFTTPHPGREASAEPAIAEHRQTFLNAARALLDRYQWTGSEQGATEAGFKTRYGLIIPGGEMTGLYSKIGFTRPRTEAEQSEEFLNIMVGQWVDLDEEDYSALSVLAAKIDQISPRFQSGGRRFYARWPRTVDGWSGLAVASGQSPDFASSQPSGRLLMSWYDRRQRPTVMIRAWGQSFTLGSAETETSELLGLWEAILDSARLGPPTLPEP